MSPIPILKTLIFVLLERCLLFHTDLVKFAYIDLARPVLLIIIILKVHIVGKISSSIGVAEKSSGRPPFVKSPQGTSLSQVDRILTPKIHRRQRFVKVSTKINAYSLFHS